MKKYIINGRFISKQITGVQRFAREILLELDQLIEKNQIELVIPPGDYELPNYKNIKIKKVGKLKNNLWEQISLPIYVKKKKAISINLCNSAPILCPGIICIHDVKIKAKPECFSKKFLIWYNFLFDMIINNSKCIITVSEFSKSEIIKYYGIDSKKIHVLYNGWQHFNKISFDKNILQKCELSTDGYFFAMSSLEPNKNFKWIAEVAKKNPNDIFAIAGSINNKVFSEGIGFDCPNNMKLLGYVSDSEAKTLMKECRAFLFPSFYEGFGIPPLEALASGAKLIIISDTTVMHEIYDKKAIYIDTSDYNYDMKELIKKNELKFKISNQSILDNFSWKSTAIKLKSILDE